MSTKQSKKNGTASAAEEEDRKMRKLFVDKLNSSITQDDIYSVFSKHGEIEEVAKYQDRRAPNRYFAFVVYKYAKDCVKATHNPCPIIRGRKCACMLAAIGKQFSGYKFFVDKGLLTEEEKAQQRQQNKRHKTKKNNSRNRHKSTHNNTPNSNKSVANMTNTPSFPNNDRSYSAVRSNTSFIEEPSPRYDNQPSWTGQPYTNSTNSLVTNISEQMPSHPTTLNLPSFQRASKSLHELPQMGQSQQYAYSYNNAIGNANGNGRQYSNKGLQQTQSYNNRHSYVSNGYPPQNGTNNAQWHYAQYNNGMRRPRAQSQPYQYANMPTQRQSMSYSRIPMPSQPQPQPQRQTQTQQKYSLSPQLQPHNTRNTITMVPPMPAVPRMQKRSASYTNMFAAPQRTQTQSQNQIRHTLVPPMQAYSNSSKPYELKRQTIAQCSAPKLPLLSSKPKHNKSENMRKSAGNNANTPSIYRSSSARTINTNAKMLINEDIPCPDLLFDNFSMDLPTTPSPPMSPMPPPLLMNSGAKISIEMDSPFDVPKKYESVEDAKKASDQELEAGFIMLEASPTPATEYDSEDNEGREN